MVKCTCNIAVFNDQMYNSKCAHFLINGAYQQYLDLMWHSDQNQHCPSGCCNLIFHL